MIFFTADTHWGHARLASVRGFASTDEMDRVLVDAWNDRVGPRDTVYHLGDMSFAKPERTATLLGSLNFRELHLVAGNHDKGDRWGWRVSSVRPYAELKFNKRLLVLCHYGLAVWRNSHHGSLHLHGHSHGSLPPIGRRMDVGVDAVDDWAPVSIDSVIETLEARPVAVVDYHGEVGP